MKSTDDEFIYENHDENSSDTESDFLWLGSKSTRLYRTFWRFR